MKRWLATYALRGCKRPDGRWPKSQTASSAPSPAFGTFCPR